MEMKQRIKEFLGNILKNEDHEATWMYMLTTHNGKRWALVVAWMDYDDENDWKLYAKLAYQPTNYIMQEYDIDWLMPYDAETGEVDNTELMFETSVGEADVDWLLEQWERFKKEYVYKEDEDNE